MSDHPFLDRSFEIKWSKLTPEHVVADMEEGIRRANLAIADICNVPKGQETWENSFAALENAGQDLDSGWLRVMHLASVNDSEELRQAFEKAMGPVSHYYASIPLNPKLWQVLKRFSENKEACEKLSPIQKRYLSETLKSFQEGGADLPEEQKAEVAKIHAELAGLTQQFSQKNLDSTNAWEFVTENISDLAGLPQSALDAAKADAEAHGQPNAWRFTQQMPSLIPIMQFAESEELRKKAWQGSISICTGDFDTEPLIRKIVSLRDKKSKLLGFANYADQATSRRMAKSGQNAIEFVEKLHEKVLPCFQKDVKQVLDFKREKTGDASAELKPWDVAFWSEKLRRQLYDFDNEALRPYFPMDGVMKGMFHIAETLFGIRVEKTPKGEVETWNPEVEFFRVYDKETDQHIGSFYTDWYPRESKRSGAWMNCLTYGQPSPRQPHLGLMCGNMTRPIKSKPALLTHAEVETIFHEFGHLLHQLLSNVEIKSLSGTNVAWDFVELPSQIMENWCWNRQAIDLFARHYETGETIPQELFDKMIAAKNFQSAMAFIRQLLFGKLDLELHLRPEQLASANSIDELDRELLKDYRIHFQESSPSIARRLGHLFSDPDGYAAGYYSYKWAEVLDADAFSRFENEGILNPETGKDFRNAILSRGNSCPPDELYREFMHRDPDQNALLKRSGII